MVKNIIKTTKFHSINMIYRYCIRENCNQAKLNLLAYVLRNTNALFKTRTSWNKHLDSLYSADFYVASTRLGNASFLTFQFKVVHPKYVNDPSYTLDGLKDFFLSIVNSPNIEGDLFEEKSFNLAKNEAINDMLMKNENKAMLAREQALSLYFKGTDANIPFDGTIEELTSLSNADLVSYYREIIRNEGIFMATGDIDYPETDYAYKLDSYLIKQRGKLANQYITVKDNVNQTNLFMIYDLAIFKNDPDYYASIILNYILGISPTSKLFINIRENHSLCYSIRSSYMPIYGINIISAGIDSKNIDKVVALVKENINAISEGDFKTELLEEAVIFFKNGFLAALDNQRSYLSDQFSLLFVAGTLPDEVLLERLSNVTKHDICRVAKAFAEPFIYVLRGEGNE